MPAKTNKITKKETIPFDKKKKRIIKRKGGKKTTGEYFTDETQVAIKNYQLEDDLQEKQKIYEAKIQPAFDSLVENLINVYSFKIMHETKRDLKTECMEFLFTTVNKFDDSKGFKAFSYFNVVAKRWLTIKSKQNAKKVKTNVSVDDKDNLSAADIEHIELHNVIPSIEDVLIAKQNNKNINYIVKELQSKVKNENEQICVNAIKEIVDNIEDIEIFNKKAVLLYLREICGFSSKTLSQNLSSIKKHYREIKKDLEDE